MKKTKHQIRKEKNARQRQTVTLLESLFEEIEPGFETLHITEPKLVFGGGTAFVDPKIGIDLYGPFDLTSSEKTIRVAIVGTGHTIALAMSMLQNCESKIAPGLNSKGKPFDSILFPHFPGNTLDTGFRCQFVTDSSMHRTMREADLQLALKTTDDRERLKAITQLFVTECEALSDVEPTPHVVLLALPEIIHKEFGPSGALSKDQIKLTDAERIKLRLQQESERTGQQILSGIFAEVDKPADNSPDGFWNLHHALKAHCMKFDFPVQFIWESTLDGSGTTQDSASVAWNLSAALYYKAGNLPWQIQSMPDNTCFVGISFYKENPLSNAHMQTSLAQVFGAGDGLVLKGQRAVVEKKRDRRPHLTEEGAYDILKRAIELYTGVNRQAPKRVVVHKTSKFWPEEQAGMKRALDGIYYYDFIALNETPSFRFMRLGHKPPLRGTAIILEPRRYLLYTVGYIPYFKEYPGMRTPRPLEIMEHIGDASPYDICREIMGLTKLNWNSCAFFNSSPITISFARSVGKILTEFTGSGAIKNRYRFYM